MSPKQCDNGWPDTAHVWDMINMNMMNMNMINMNEYAIQLRMQCNR